MALRTSHLHAGDPVRIRGERWRVVRRVPYGDVTLLEVSGADEANRGTRAGFLLPFETLERVIVPAAPRVVRPSTWRRIARSALAHATPGAHALRAAVRAHLAMVPFQLEPALAITSARGCRLLIADEVGLGKTIQAGFIVAEVFAREADARALVVCPAGLRAQWQAELEERFGLHAVVLDAATLARVGSAQGPGVNPWLSLRLAVTSIDYLKRPEVLRAVEPVVWDVVVFDEAHALAGPSDRAAAASALGTRARRVVMLTATPHSGDEEAFHRLCEIGHLAGDPPLIVFRRSRRDAGIASVRRTTTLRVRPSREEIAVHDALLAYARRVWDGSSAAQPGARLAMTVLMRRACSSVTSLARSLERRRSLLTTTPFAAAQLTLPFLAPDEDDEPVTFLGVPGLDDVTEEQRALERLLVLARLAAAAGERKLAALGRLLRRVHEPLLVFTEYRDTLAHVATQLPVAAVTLHGGMTPRQRQGAAREFTEGSASVLLATDAASEGLNLQRRCRLVINLELPWTPLRLEQRVGRVDRIGQSRAVHAVNLVAHGTGEETVVARLVARQARARASLEQIGEAVVRGTPLTAVAPGSDASDTSHRDVVTGDLRVEARAEAERLRTAHRLLERHASLPSRPVICVLRRQMRTEPRRVWAWRLTFVDGHGRVIWESLLPLCAEAEGGPHTAAWARTSLDWRNASLAACLEQAEEASVAALAEEMRAPVALLTSREHAIARVLEERQARLAAALLQPGLFDRRAERAAAAQASLLNEARSRTVARLIELKASGHPMVEERRLVFAVALQ